MMMMGDGYGTGGTAYLEPYHQWQTTFAGLHGYQRWQQQQQQQQQYEQQQQEFQLQQQQLIQQQQQNQQTFGRYYGSGSGFANVAFGHDVTALSSPRALAPTQAAAAGTHSPPSSSTSRNFGRTANSGRTADAFCGRADLTRPDPIRPDMAPPTLRPTDFPSLAPLVFCPPPMFEFGSAAAQSSACAATSGDGALQRRDFYTGSGNTSATVRSRLTSPTGFRSRDDDVLSATIRSTIPPFSDSSSFADSLAINCWKSFPARSNTGLLSPTAIAAPSTDSALVSRLQPASNAGLSQHYHHHHQHQQQQQQNSPASSADLSSPPEKKSNQSTGRPRVRRTEKKPIPEELKDDRYFDRRKKNNEAARRSRETRKRNIDDLEKTADYLRQQNECYRVHVESLRAEVQKYQELLTGPPVDMQTLQVTLARFRHSIQRNDVPPPTLPPPPQQQQQF